MEFSSKILIAKFWPSKVRARILYYHSIGDSDNKSLPISDFDNQIKWLLKNNYKIVKFSNFVEQVYKYENFKEKVIAITFDDGYEDNYLNAFPIILKHKIAATIFIVAGVINQNTLYLDKNLRLYNNRKILNISQIQEMASKGIEIGSHSLYHINVANNLKHDYRNCYKDLINSKNILEKIINKEINIFSYPNGQKGTFNKQTKSVLRKIGYVAAATTMLKEVFWEKPDIYAVPRIEIKSTDKLDIFVNKIMGKYDYLSYYYRLVDLSNKW